MVGLLLFHDAEIETECLPLQTSLENCSPRDSFTSTKLSICTIAWSAQKIKLSSLLNITSAVSAHDFAIGEGAVDITVGFTDVPQPKSNSKIEENKSRVRVRSIMNLMPLVRGQITFAIDGWLPAKYKTITSLVVAV